MATITVSNAGGNWNATGTWVGGVIPLSTDNVIFTSTSGNLTINVTSNIVDFDLTNYLGTITFTAPLIVIGNLNLGTGGYTQAGATGIDKAGTGSITSNGVVWSRRFRFNGTYTVTLNDDFNISGALMFQAGGATMTVNGFNIYHTGTFLITNNGGVIAGTTKYWYKGTGTTWAQGVSTPIINIDFYVDTVGTLTMTGTSINGIIFGANKELKVISGSLVTTGLSALSLSGRTVDFNGNVVNNLRFIIASQTVTLLSNTTVKTLTIPAVNTQTLNGFKLTTTNITQTGATGTFNGTTDIDIVGTGTWSNSGRGTIRNNVTFKSTAITTLTGNIHYDTGVLSDESGCSVTTIGSTLNVDASTTISTGYINWDSVNITSGTVTLNALFTVIGTLSLASLGNIIFTGISGFTCNTMSCVTAGRTITLKNGTTYQVTNSLILTGITASNITFQSSTTSYANLYLSYSANQSVTNTNSTWIDSSGGQTINTSAGTLSNTLNWAIASGNFLLMF